MILWYEAEYWGGGGEKDTKKGKKKWKDMIV